MKNDTIAAISTALGQGAISIIRMSGPDALNIIKKVFLGRDLANVNSHTIHYGKIHDQTQILDEVLVSVFKAPKTFTKEDIVEINTHGGVFVAQKVLETLLKNGARIAENGEFTERAYLNGRIDLTQAESVMDMIEARSNLSLALANKGLEGKLYQLILRLREQLLTIIATIEVNIDYPEYDDVEQLTTAVLLPKSKALLEEVVELLKTADTGQVIKEGVKTAIIGRPNVGKSSLLNALLNEEKAIVTEYQGTTRDIVEGTISIGGIILHLIDTAGIRESDDVIEKIGIDKAKAVINEAELILYVLNNNEPLTEEDCQLLDLTEHKKRLVIINKIDLESKINRTFDNSVAISALNRTNIDLLEQHLQQLILKSAPFTTHQVYLSNARHIGLMTQVKSYLEDAIHTASNHYPVDMVEIDLKMAWESLGEIIGDTKDSALLDALFSQFCLGK